MSTENIVYNGRHSQLLQLLVDNKVPQQTYDLFMRKMKITQSLTKTCEKLRGVISNDNLTKCVTLYTTGVLIDRETVPNITFHEFPVEEPI